MRLRALLLSSLIAVCALVAVGCGISASGGSKPALGDLVGSSLRAVAGQDDLKVHYAVTAKLDATPSAQASEETRKFLSDPISLSASGGLSKGAVTLAGTFGLLGKSYSAEARVGQSETYVNLLGSWYGDSTKGLGDAKQSAQDKAGSKADPEQVKKALRWIYDHSDEVLDAQVTAGPDIDGPTWQAKGHCRADAVVDLVGRNGAAVSSADRKGIETLCRLTEITYVIGADDHLPRELRVVADLDNQAITQLAAGSGDGSARELDALHMDVAVKLTQWGQDVTFKAPANPKPMEDLGTALLSLMFTAMS
jgi:hypothetical protein